MSTEKFSALKAGDSLDFWGQKHPKCPHCGHVCDVNENEWWHLYDGEEKMDVECPSCDQEFTVSTRVSYSFDTDSQEEA